MLKIAVTQEGQAPLEVTLGEAPRLLGRAPINDIVLSDDQISWHHAAVWVEGGRAWVRDVGSKNGTFLNGHRLRAAEPFTPDDRVTLGPATVLRMAGASVQAARALLVEDLDSGVRLPIRADRFHIGSDPAADLRVDGPPRAALLVIEDDGEVVLATDDSALAIYPGQRFEVAGRRLRVVEMPATQAPTLEPTVNRYAYRLRARLDGPTGAEARLEDPSTGTTWLVEAENRAILLYVLARQVVADLESRKSDGEVGWVGDDEVSVGVWGRGGPSDANSLHVLVYRLRKEIGRAGFDPWFIEKRRRALRLRLSDVELG